MNEHSVEIPDDDEVPDASPITSTTNTSARKDGRKRNPLPTVSLLGILAHKVDPANIIWEGRVLAVGEEACLIGAPGVGKSRLMLQAAICTILGKAFLKWQTSGQGKRWLFIQNENGMDRLKSDAERMTRGMTMGEKTLIDDHICITNIGAPDFEGISMNANDPNRDRVIDTIEDFDPDIVVIDPLRDAGHADLNSDAGMTETLQAVKRVVKNGNPRRIPFPIHHGRTGESAAKDVFGDNAASFGRNSKVMIGWTRSQINVAWAGTEEDGIVIFGCGKNSNGPRWKPFAAQLDTETMTYHVLEEFDLDAWASGAGSKTGKSAAQKKLPTPEEIAELVRRAGGTVTGGINEPEGLVKRVQNSFGVTRAGASDAIKAALGFTIQRVGGDRIGGTQQCVSYVLKDAS
jgi:hypothetical protein